MSRGLAESAPICVDYTMTGECLTEQGMEVGGQFRKFDEPCHWTLDLLVTAGKAAQCSVAIKGQILCRSLSNSSPHPDLVCGFICAGIDTVREHVTNTSVCSVAMCSSSSMRHAAIIKLYRQAVAVCWHAKGGPAAFCYHMLIP